MWRNYNPVRLYQDGYDWTGRTSRSQLLVVLIFMGLIYLPIVNLHWFGKAARIVEIAGWISIALMTVPLWGHIVRRFNHMRWPAALALLLLVPPINLIVLAILLIKNQGQRRLFEMTPLRTAGFYSAVLVAVIALSRIIWTPYFAPAGSMKPNLLIGDVFAVWRLDRTPDYGDVMVFTDPTTNTIYVKRVIALGGDTVKMTNGVPQVNGTPLQQSPVDPFIETMEPQGQFKNLPRCSNGAVGYGATCVKEQFTEIATNGSAYSVLSTIPNAPMDTTNMFTVPQGHVFFMGDNRDNSRDSRISVPAGGLGFVPETAIVGQAVRILYSFKGDYPYQLWTWRGSRIFKAIE